ncbi:hypothetical protein ACWDNT_28075, partial [Streptomyces sp. NPDC000963]
MKTAGRTPAPRPYRSYVYAYPHKTAYRELSDPPELAALVAGVVAALLVPQRDARLGGEALDRLRE